MDWNFDKVLLFSCTQKKSQVLTFISFPGYKKFKKIYKKFAFVWLIFSFLGGKKKKQSKQFFISTRIITNPKGKFSKVQFLNLNTYK